MTTATRSKPRATRAKQPAKQAAKPVAAALPSTREVLAMGAAAGRVVAQFHAEEKAEAAAVASLPKCAAGRVQRGRPHPNLLFVIASKGNHPGKGDRIKRWAQYKIGMSVLHCRITEGLDHLDIGYYTRHNGTDGKPLMVLRPMTDAERKAAVARWDGEAVDKQPAAGTVANGGGMNASDSAQSGSIAEPSKLGDAMRAAGFTV